MMTTPRQPSVKSVLEREFNENVKPLKVAIGLLRDIAENWGPSADGKVLTLNVVKRPYIHMPVLVARYAKPDSNPTEFANYFLAGLNSDDRSAYPQADFKTVYGVGHFREDPNEQIEAAVTGPLSFKEAFYCSSKGVVTPIMSFVRQAMRDHPFYIKSMADISKAAIQSVPVQRVPI